MKRIVMALLVALPLLGCGIKGEPVRPMPAPSISGRLAP